MNLNVLKTASLLSVLSLLLLALGEWIGGPQGLLCASVLVCTLNIAVYAGSSKIVLAAHRAEPLDENEAPEVYDILRELIAEAGLPMPRIYLIPSASPNLFVIGRGSAHVVIALTQGIFKCLNREEMAGALAHELAHIHHRDCLTSSVVALLGGGIIFVASFFRSLLGGGEGGRKSAGENNPVLWLVMGVVMPIAAGLIHSVIYPSREYAADAEGARLTSNPLYLASALKKLDAGKQRLPMRNVNPAMAHLFILSPLQNGGFSKLFCTHPPLEKRIAKLDCMARAMGI